jgi:hypothetical protein
VLDFDNHSIVDFYHLIQCIIRVLVVGVVHKDPRGCRQDVWMDVFEMKEGRTDDGLNIPLQRVT